MLSGIGALKVGSSALVDGVTKLQEGSMQLSEGMQELNDSGIQPLVEAVDDVDGLVARLKATVDVSNDYNSFGGISDDMSGTVRFVYRTESIGE